MSESVALSPKVAMLSSRTAQQSAAIARRPSRQTILAHLTSTDGAVDLVGPPDPITNLRPVQYAARFRAPNPTTNTRKLHPYSLEEFSSPSPASTLSPASLLDRKARQSNDKLERLELLRQRFEAQDLEWRLQRRRLDQISHEHWARSNTAFMSQKAEAESQAHERIALSTLSSGPPTTASVTSSRKKPSELRIDPQVMERFLKNWVESRGKEYENYQRIWVGGILGQMKPAIKARYREWRWKFELWRCGLL